jgi:hypothetical protein
MAVIYVSTAKSNLPERRDFDHYATEPGAVDAALCRYALRSATSILDIGADTGQWGHNALKYAPAASILAGVDIRPIPKPQLYTDWYTLDYAKPMLAKGIKHRFDLIVSNPPFSDAEDIIWNAWTYHLHPGGRMVFLLPLDFQTTKGRYNRLFRDLPPIQIDPYVRRIRFTTEGNPNNCALYVWEKDSQGRNRGRARQWQSKMLWHAKRGEARQLDEWEAGR